MYSLLSDETSLFCDSLRYSTIYLHVDYNTKLTNNLEGLFVFFNIHTTCMQKLQEWEKYVHEMPFFKIVDRATPLNDYKRWFRCPLRNRHFLTTQRKLRVGLWGICGIIILWCPERLSHDSLSDIRWDSLMNMHRLILVIILALWITCRRSSPCEKQRSQVG